MAKQLEQSYLGDGVYATFDYSTGNIWLDCRAQPGFSVGPDGHRGICLAPEVTMSLAHFSDRIAEALKVMHDDAAEPQGPAS